MRRLLIVLLVIPMTAVLTAAATVLALRYPWPNLPAFAPSESTPADAAEPRNPSRQPPVVMAMTPEPTDRAAGTSPAPIPPIAPSRPRELPTPVAVPVSIAPTAGAAEPPKPARDDAEPGVETATVSTAPNPSGAQATAPIDALAAGIDYVKLTDGLQQISDALDRFNQKLLHAIAQARAAPGSVSTIQEQGR